MKQLTIDPKEFGERILAAITKLAENSRSLVLEVWVENTRTGEIAVAVRDIESDDTPEEHHLDALEVQVDRMTERVAVDEFLASGHSSDDFEEETIKKLFAVLKEENLL